MNPLSCFQYHTEAALDELVLAPIRPLLQHLAGCRSGDHAVVISPIFTRRVELILQSSFIVDHFFVHFQVPGVYTARHSFRLPGDPVKRHSLYFGSETILFRARK